MSDDPGVRPGGLDIIDIDDDNGVMASLNVRNLPEEVRDRLRVRAAKAGRSMEAEAREILTAATLGSRRCVGALQLQRFVDKLYSNGRPAGVVDDLIRERRKEAEIE